MNNVDLSALDRLTAHAETPEKVAEGKGISTQKGSQGGTQPLTGRRYPWLEAERETAQKMTAAYREYQDNIKRAGQLRADITKGIQAGEDPCTLLLWAMEAISRMTGDRLFYDQGRANLLTIYAHLGYSAPITHHAQEVQERLSRLCSALDVADDPGDRERITRAIKAHRQRLEQLEEQAKSAGR